MSSAIEAEVSNHFRFFVFVGISIFQTSLHNILWSKNAYALAYILILVDCINVMIMYVDKLF